MARKRFLKATSTGLSGSTSQAKVPFILHSENGQIPTSGDIAVTFSTSDIIIDWDDGTSNQESPPSFSLQHTYSVGANRTVTLSSFSSFNNITGVAIGGWFGIVNPATIDCDRLTGLTSFVLFNVRVTTILLSNSPELTTLSCRFANITTIDFSASTILPGFNLSSNSLTSATFPQITTVNYQAELQFNNFSSIDISNLNLALLIRLQNNSLTALDVSNQTNMIILLVNSNSITALNMDTIIIDLDNIGNINGFVNISSNNGRTSASDTAFANLIANGWTIST